jgi:hypothetical protein
MNPCLPSQGRCMVNQTPSLQAREEEKDLGQVTDSIQSRKINRSF